MTNRTKLAPRALALTLLAAPALAATPALATPATVNLRIEGAAKTLFEQAVTTDGHTVTTASGGTHTCDGTNGAVNPTPGPSATAALDDGAKLAGFTWDGAYGVGGFDDYLVSRIGPETQGGGKYWSLLVNFQFSNVGGCQQRVKQGDEVLWALVGTVSHALRLTGPASAITGRPFTVRVTDGADGAPIAGATVGGATTGSDGRAGVTIAKRGLYRLKAERSDSIRSNAVAVCVDPPGAAPCTSFDQAPPTVRLSLPGGIASEGSRSRRIQVSWAGFDPAGGSGVTSYDVDARRVADAIGRPTTGWFSLVSHGTPTSTLFRGGAGSAFQFRARAGDRAGNVGPFAVGGVVIPIDDRDTSYVKRSKGWSLVRRTGAFRQRVLRSKRKGAAARLEWRGRQIVLIGRKLRHGGRLRITVDGKSRVVRLRGTPQDRDELFTSAARAAGVHKLRIEAAGGGPVEIDAVAPVP